MMGSAESPFIWALSALATGNLGNPPPWAVSDNNEVTMSLVWRGAMRARSGTSER